MICYKEKFGSWKAMAGALLGMSIAFINIDNLAWSINIKSYSAIIIAIIMFVGILVVQKNEKSNNEKA